jgi:hypothetical protein
LIGFAAGLAEIPTLPEIPPPVEIPTLPEAAEVLPPPPLCPPSVAPVQPY